VEGFNTTGNRTKDKQWLTKYYTENYILSNMSRNTKRGWPPVW